MTTDPDPRAALDALASALDPASFTTTRLASPTRLPRLRITSRHAGRLAEDIYIARGYYWWSWAETISPLNDPDTAAAKITRVLRATPAGQADAASPTGGGHD